MNAIEMALKTMLEKAFASLQDRLPELINNLPPEIVANIGQISQTVLSFKGQLDRIENQQRLIIAHLNIPADADATARCGADITEHENARLERPGISKN